MFTALLEKAATALDRADIPYMVTGGQAALRYGEARLTRDIDLALGVDVDRLPEVLTVTVECGFEVLVDPEPFVRETMVLPCLDPGSGIRLDLVFSFSPYKREAIARALPVTIGATPVRFATVEDLVNHKIIAGRPRDLEDVRGILLKNPGLDMVFAEKHLGAIGSAVSFVATELLITSAGFVVVGRHVLTRASWARVARTAVAAVAMFGVAYALRGFGVIALAPAGLTFIAAAYLLGIPTAEERAVLASAGASVRRRLSRRAKNTDDSEASSDNGPAA